ncbi:MAG: PP2C family protein-serine/threonine phosphatase [Pirellulaceae bacterium]
MEKNPTTERMQCMEIWGGNARIDRQFRTPGLHLWLHSHPSEGAVSGGDVYYVSSCASGRITRLLLADVSGHGEHVAGVATGLRDLMRQNINLFDQRQFVRAMNRQFSELAREQHFATAVVCTFFAPNQSLQFSNAGHPDALLYRAKTGRWMLARELAVGAPTEGLADVPLGVAGSADYTQCQTRLAAGDMVLCVSDAFTECRDRDGKLLGPEGLLRIVGELDTSRPANLLAQLRSQLTELSSDNLRLDDATAILLQADGSHVTFMDNLLALYHYVQPVRDRTELVG